MDKPEFKPFDFTSILNRTCVNTGSAILVNISIMGSQPEIVVFDDYDALCHFASNNPNITLMIQSVPRYGKNS